MPNLLRDIESIDSFCRIVEEMLLDAPAPLANAIRCTHTINRANFEYAFNEYIAGVQRFAARLHSKDPDHRKRASALIRAIVISQLVQGSEMNTEDLQRLEAGLVGNAHEVQRFAMFYSTLHKEVLPLEVAYRCCRLYENPPSPPTFARIHDACLYLKNHQNVDVETCFLLFNSIFP
jgi:hypothetical protein